MDQPNLEKLSADQFNLKALCQGKVLVIGDLMLDTYWIGDAQRISPEAPVPVVHVGKKNHFLGGAGNVARNIAALGGRVSLLGIVGCDAEGRQLESMLEAQGIENSLIRSPGRPTTVKTRVLARNQQMIRLDTECALPFDKGIMDAVQFKLTALVQEFSVIIVSDYHKGLVQKTLLPMIKQKAQDLGLPEPYILIDPKPQNVECYTGAYLLTPNTKETSELSGGPSHPLPELLHTGRNLRQKLQAQHLLTTLGAEGMALFTVENGQEAVWHIPTAARQVFDVTGAGDTVIATLGLCLSAHYPLLESCIIANYAAGIVVGEVGAATASKSDLFAAMQQGRLHVARLL